MIREPSPSRFDAQPSQPPFGVNGRRIVIVAPRGQVPEYLLSLLRAAGALAIVLPELGVILRHMKDPADLIIVGIPAWKSEGIDVMAKIRAAVPAIPVIAVSGTSVEELYLHVPEYADGSRILAQPFTPEALGCALDNAFARQALGPPHAPSVLKLPNVGAPMP